MTDNQKIEKLKFILRDQIIWYREAQKKTEEGKVDGSYVYDMLYEEFNNLRRGDFVELLEVLLGEV